MSEALALIAATVSTLALLPVVVLAGFVVSLGFRAGRLRARVTGDDSRQG